MTSSQGEKQNVLASRNSVRKGTVHLIIFLYSIGLPQQDAVSVRIATVAMTTKVAQILAAPTEMMRKRIPQAELVAVDLGHDFYVQTMMKILEQEVIASLCMKKTRAASSLSLNESRL